MPRKSHSLCARERERLKAKLIPYTVVNDHREQRVLQQQKQSQNAARVGQTTELFLFRIAMVFRYLGFG
jgi:hypothetical protein